MRSIFKELTVQTLPQGSRKIVFHLLAVFMENKLSGIELTLHHEDCSTLCVAELVPMKSDFVKGYIQAMDGEKDPRNLLVCFSLGRRSTYACFYIHIPSLRL